MVVVASHRPTVAGGALWLWYNVAMSGCYGCIFNLREVFGEDHEAWCGDTQIHCLKKQFKPIWSEGGRKVALPGCDKFRAGAPTVIEWDYAPVSVGGNLSPYFGFTPEVKQLLDAWSKEQTLMHDVSIICRSVAKAVKSVAARVINRYSPKH